MKHILFGITGVLILITGVFAIERVRASATGSTTDKSEVPRASVVMVSRGSIANTLTVAGEFLPLQEVDIHAKVAGYIKQINVDIGDRVRAGQTLAKLEIPELGAQVEGADASVRHSAEEISRARNEVIRAQASHEALHAAATRLQQAAAARPGLVAQQEIDDSVAKDRAAEAQVDAAKAALLAAQQQLDISKANRTQVGALWDYSHIVAPFSGIITWRYADTGALVQAGTSNASAQPVVKIAEIDTLRLRVPVPESLAANIRLGSPADVTVQATKEHFVAKVARFTDSLDRSTRTMQVEFDIPNHDRHLAPGMFADVVLQVQQHAQTLTIPVQAVQTEKGAASVLVLDAHNRIMARPITTGLEEPSKVEVVSGLKEGDRVIVGNLSTYHDGEVVDPKLSRLADATFDSTAGGQ